LEESSTAKVLNRGFQNPRRKSTGHKKAGGKKSSNQKMPSLENCGKSKSCESSCGPISPTKRRRELEVKRKSIYGQECKGRNDARPCNKCQTTADQVLQLVTMFTYVWKLRDVFVPSHGTHSHGGGGGREGIKIMVCIVKECCCHNFYS
jgi:hypothetical protein